MDFETETVVIETEFMKLLQLFTQPLCDCLPTFPFSSTTFLTILLRYHVFPVLIRASILICFAFKILIGQLVFK